MALVDITVLVDVLQAENVGGCKKIIGRERPRDCRPGGVMSRRRDALGSTPKRNGFDLLIIR